MFCVCTFVMVQSNIKYEYEINILVVYKGNHTLFLSLSHSYTHTTNYSDCLKIVMCTYFFNLYVISINFFKAQEAYTYMF